MCKFSDKYLQEKFPHLLEEQKLNHNFLQVLITESRLEGQIQDSAELITIKEEILDDFEETKTKSNVVSDLSSGEEFIPTKPPTIQKKKEPVEKKTTGVRKRPKYDKRLFPCHLCGKTYDKWRLEIHLNAHNSNLKPIYDCMLN